MYDKKRLTAFATVLLEELAASRAATPELYAQAPSTVVVHERIMDVLADKDVYSISINTQTFKNVAKRLSITHSYKAFDDYLNALTSDSAQGTGL